MISSRRAPARLAMATAAGTAVIWFVHLAASYALVPTSCRIQSALPLLVATVIGVAIGAGSTVIAARAEGPPGSWRERLRAVVLIGDDPGGATGAPSARIATAGLALAGYFTFVMLLAALIPILVDPCA